MVGDIAHQRCFNHAAREAVARCPECSRYYCRECVTEHEDRVLCASCIAEVASKTSTAKQRLAFVSGAVQFALALLVLWGFFYALGQGLLALPSSFHEGTVWQADFWEP